MGGVEVKGHWCNSKFDGRLTYERGNEPDVIVVNGRVYQYVPMSVGAYKVLNGRLNKYIKEGAWKSTPEDGIARETR